MVTWNLRILLAIWIHCFVLKLIFLGLSNNILIIDKSTTKKIFFAFVNCIYFTNAINIITHIPDERSDTAREPSGAPIHILDTCHCLFMTELTGDRLRDVRPAKTLNEHCGLGDDDCRGCCGNGRIGCVCKCVSDFWNSCCVARYGGCCDNYVHNSMMCPPPFNLSETPRLQGTLVRVHNRHTLDLIMSIE